MPECRYCDSFVTRRYLRVFAPDDLEAKGVVRTCPQCTPQREGSDIRKARGRGAGYQEGEVAATDGGRE